MLVSVADTPLLFEHPVASMASVGHAASTRSNLRIPENLHLITK
jgi:hypothetical protein